MYFRATCLPNYRPDYFEIVLGIFPPQRMTMSDVDATGRSDFPSTTIKSDAKAFGM